MEVINNNDNIFEKEKKDMKTYMIEYRKKNLDKWYKDNICEDCGGRYKNCAKTNHLRSVKHKYAVLLKEKMN